MTDEQMTDFEARLADRLQAFAAIPVRDVDELAIARASIGSVGPGWLGRWLSPLRTLSTPVVIAGLLLIAMLVTVLAAGSVLDRLFATTIVPTPSPIAHPFVEELASATTAQISSSSAIRLADGRVLIVGGTDTTGGQATIDRAWLFEPATKRITETGRMTTPRSEPLLALLADGRVLVVGGMNIDGNTEAVEGAELYDPAFGTFRRTAGDPAARMNSPQGAFDHAWASPQITPLGDGRVLISGGASPGNGAEAGPLADLYDPSTDRFEQLEIGCDALRGTQVLLADGRVLVTCLPARGSDVIAAAIFDPATRKFTPTGPPSTRANDIGNLLPNGTVLFTGSSVDPGADLYDPVTGTFSTIETSGRPDGNTPGFDIGRGRLLFLGLADPESPMATLIFEGARLDFREIELPSLQLGEPTVALEDGRLFQVHYQLGATLLDPSQLP